MTEIIDKTSTDKNLRFEHPRPPKVTAPSIDAALAIADEAAIRAASAAAEQVQARNAALHLSTKIETLRTQRDALTVRLANLEVRLQGIPASRAAREASITRLLCAAGIDYDPARNEELNTAIATLPSLDKLEKLLPKIIASVKAEHAEIVKQLAELESTK